HLFVIDTLIFPTYPVMDSAEPLAGEIGRRAVRQVAAGGQRQAENGVARLGECEQHGLVGLATRMRLHIGKTAIEESLGPLDRQRLGLVDKLAATVVA